MFQIWKKKAITGQTWGNSDTAEEWTIGKLRQIAENNQEMGQCKIYYLWNV